ncbi:FAD-binding protein [Microbacterium saccharophilum]|uniref:FAD-binding protein n=1 Tax=Microbacterium saccharophilum TaxID=1213358 RepID=A0A5C8I5Y0_9MICO|nr:FAD-binding protein [Microbacterium saccharophilum]TXK14887.1 FAD-binding protein [Microbacterium saccharophilum]GEP47275.1 putative xylitol oxidase [Microbacterium saccharophilum]
MTDAGTNWAGNISYAAERLVAPRTLEELAEIVVSEPKVRVLGSRHSFNRIADTPGVLVSLAALDETPQLDTDRATVRVPGGLRYGDLAPWLHERGWALRNLASLPHISVAGAVATGTHGSGERIGSLATQVAALELLTADGEVVRMARGDEDFDGAVVSLGALGIVTALELDVVPTYDIAQTVYEGVRWDAALAAFDELQRSGDSVSLFTTWRSADDIDQVWVKTRGAAPDLRAIGGAPADGPRHPLPGIDPAPCTVQGGVPGPWYDRLPHFRLAFTPSAGEELQSEYLVPRADAPAAIAALRALAPRIAPLLQVCEVRTIAADRLWLSPAYEADSLALHFTWLLDEAGVTALLPELEAALPRTARPHWGKVFTMPSAEIAARYPRWVDFSGLRDRLDPQRRFGNAFLDDLGLG